MTSLHHPAPLDTSKHQRDRFDCGYPEYNEWLRQYARQNRRRNTAAVHVITDAEHQVVAYMALSMTGIDISAAPPALRKGAPKQIPAVEIGRLAVDSGHNRLGLGTTLAKLAFTKALEANADIACQVVFVKALDTEARQWWRRFGFQPFSDDPDELKLYLLTKEIRATLEDMEARRLPPAGQS